MILATTYMKVRRTLEGSESCAGLGGKVNESHRLTERGGAGPEGDPRAEVLSGGALDCDRPEDFTGSRRLDFSGTTRS